ncbi:MAG: anthranilate phosphoribosyltransferase, partial [Gemmatimonadales bacterium]|nr:anthranilate phosphoribosyltransferase [Gemmatimonadales bacterium]
VLLNAAAAFWAAGAVDTLAAGVAAAEQAIDSGAAEAQLQSMQSV